MKDKPYALFSVEENWLPKGRINVLFIAESPPWNGEQSYFYNRAEDKKSTNLQKEILKSLNLSLDAFKHEGYFLIDSIKCRLSKQTHASVPSEVLKTCSAKFLRREINNLKPKTIFVLGDSARKALQGLQENSEFSGFKDLANHKITENYEKILSGYRVILCVYPGGQTRKFKLNIKRSFSKIIQG